MFAVIYRAFIKPSLESTYQTAWREVASYFIKHRGSYGSSLHKTEDGMWLAYSRWPDKATRDASWPGENAPDDVLPEQVKNAIMAIQNCIDQTKKLPEICMEVVDDLLHNDSFQCIK
jgi:hypothetical protein